MKSILRGRKKTADVLKFLTLLSCQKALTNSADPDQIVSEQAV